MSLEEDIMVNKVYLVRSSKTGRLKLTENNHTCVFFTEKEAKQFAANTDGTLVGESAFTTLDLLDRMSKCAGADMIDIYTGDGLQERVIPKIKDKYVNQQLTRALTRLKETQQKPYLLEFADCRFIVPGKIEGQSDIVYCIAKSDTASYTLCFTDLDEYSAWAGSSAWQPLSVNWNGLMRVAGKKEIIMNVAGNRYVLTKDKIRKVKDHIHRMDEEKKKREQEKKDEEIRKAMNEKLDDGTGGGDTDA